MDTEDFVTDACAQVGLRVQLGTGVSDRGVDIIVDPDGVAIRVQARRRSLVTDDVARRMLRETLPAGVALLVVGDRVTETARKLLTLQHGGYLDLRGRLALRTDRLIIDVGIEPVTEAPHRSDPLAGKAGLEVATALLLHPEHRRGVRELSRTLRRSPSTVSEILAALRRDGLVSAQSVVTGTDLFWRLAERWSAPRTHLARVPSPLDPTTLAPLRLGLDNAADGAGWALTDSAAAAAYGAPLAFRIGQALDFYVPDQSVVRRATTLLGAVASASEARATVRVAPVPAVVEQRVDLAANPTQWPLAHPLFVALDLAQDVGRGREILNAWTPDSQWTRVW